MVRRLSFFSLLMLALAGIAQAQSAPSVDDIIKKHIEAIGGREKLSAIKSIRVSGKMPVGPGMEAPMTIDVVRDKGVRMELTVQGMTFIRAYEAASGKGWQINPFQGKKDPEPISADELKDISEQVDIDGALVDYKTKGHKVEFVGKEKVEGSDAYKLKVTKKSGDVEYQYIDVESSLLVKQEAKQKAQGQEIDMETIIGDYKEVNGVLMAHSQEFAPKGTQERMKMTAEKIEANPKIDETKFKMPEAKPAPAPKQ